MMMHNYIVNVLVSRIPGKTGALRLLTLLALGFLAGTPASADTTYSITDLGALGGTAPNYAYVGGLNESGQVVGGTQNSNGVYHAFLYTCGQMTDLGTLGGPYSVAFGINDAGQIVGEADIPNGDTHAFIYSNGIMTDLNLPGASPNRAEGINQRGDVCGYFFPPVASGQFHAFVYTAGVAVDLGPLPGDGDSQAAQINSAGEVVGDSRPANGGYPHQAVLWSPDHPNSTNYSIQALAPHFGGAFDDDSVAYAINDAGQIVGAGTYRTTDTTYCPFLYSAGQITEFNGTDAIQGGGANSINNWGQIVGELNPDLSHKNQTPERAFTYDPTNGLRDLNMLVPPNSNWLLAEADAVNSYGQIAGIGVTNGQNHAFLLTPVGVQLPPAICQQPADETVIAGATAQFQVGANGSGPLSYRWFFNQTNLLAGAATATLTLVNAQPANAGGYSVAVTNAAGAVTSRLATLTVLVPPTIVAQPTDQTVIIGGAASFQVAASGSGPLSYQWFFNQTNPLPGATTATLTLTNAGAADGGGYSVVVTNLAGSATSVVARLSVGAYTVTDLGSLGGLNIYVGGVNDSGHVVGWAQNPAGIYRAFRYSCGQMTDLGTLGGPHAIALRINNAGQIVGGADVPNGDTHAFIYSNGIMTDLNLPGGSPNLARGINQRGDVCGYYLPPVASGQFHGFVYTAGVVVDLGPLPGDGECEGIAINSAGEVVGDSRPAGEGYPHQAVLWSPDHPNSTNYSIQNFGGPSDEESAAFAINDACQIVGAGSYRATDGTYYPFLYSAGQITEFNGTDTIQGGGANSINNWGQIVGELNSDLAYQNQTPERAFTYDPTNGLRDLNMLVAPNSNWLLAEADAVNAYGQIAGIGVTNGQNHAFLLTPIGVELPPALCQQPVDETVIAGATAQFEVAANGSGPLSYQWFFNQTNLLAGATTAALTLVNAQPANAGGYSVVVTNAAGAVTSVVATLTVLQAMPSVTWTNPAAITYGTALGSVQLNASASVAGTFAYSPTNGSVLDAGANALSVIFTPSATPGYSSVTDTVSLLVLPAPLSVTATNATRLYGQTNPVFTGTITGIRNGDNISATYSCSAGQAARRAIIPSSRPCSARPTCKPITRSPRWTAH